MSTILYAKKIIDTRGKALSLESLRDVFSEVIEIQRKLINNRRKIAYFFIDPLMNHFEAANQFYFTVFCSEEITKINTYKSGASPIQALADAKELIDHGLYDAVFLFGYEPLLTNKQIYGKDIVTNSMKIFENESLIECYNKLAHLLRQELQLSKESFIELCDQLFRNYYRTYCRVSKSEVKLERGRRIDDLGADLFHLTDCANPNIDFSGGVILASDEVCQLLEIPQEKRIRLSGVSYRMVEGNPEKLEKIAAFSHLQHAFCEAERQAEIQVVEEFKKGNLLLEVYTCYPPIPLAFLFVNRFIDDMSELETFLANYEITVTGGMNFAKAPWNNPALNGLIEMYHLLMEKNVHYGLVHGNGGIGEVQGVAIIEKYN